MYNVWVIFWCFPSSVSFPQGQGEVIKLKPTFKIDLKKDLEICGWKNQREKAREYLLWRGRPISGNCGYVV